MACYYPFLDGHLAVVPKAGYQSFRQFFKDQGIQGVTPNAASGHLYWFVRHPVSRLVSAWRYFAAKPAFPRKMGSPSYEAFVDGVLAKQYVDFHWTSQAAQLCRVPDTIWRFEDLPDVWPRLTPKKLPHLNESTAPAPDAEYRRADVEAFFSEDMGAWRNASR